MKKIYLIASLAFATSAFAQYNQPLNDNHFFKQQVAHKPLANTARLGGGYQQPLTTTVYLQDSSHQYNWNTTNNAWDTHVDGIEKFTYDCHKNITSQSYTVTSGTVVYQQQISYTYDANNLITSMSYTSISGGNSYGQQINYTYDANNNNTGYLNQYWNTTTSAWVNQTQYTNTYDANNNMINQLVQYWSSGAWVNYTQNFNYTYDANNNNTGYLVQAWNTSTSAWVYSQQYTSTYDANNNMTNQLVQNWNGTSAWVNSYQTTYYYHSISWPLTLGISGNQAVFLGSSTTLTANGASTYTWSANAGSAHTASVSVSPTSNTTYTVTGANGGCVMTQTVTVVVVTAPDICMVSTDSATNYQYNIIHWNNTLYPSADSFIVYRYSAGSYLVIGTVSKDSSRFIDANRNIGGPNGGDPNSTGWQYTLAIKDLAGNVSAKSPYHFTSNFQQNNQNLSWTPYMIQSPQSNPTNGYQILRDSLGVNDFHVFANTSYLTTSFQDPNYALYPHAQYRVDALGFNCTANQRLAGGGNNSPYTIRVRSHSNTSRQAGNGIKQYANSNEVNIYPNPSNGSFVIETNSNTKQTMQVYDVNGKMVLSQNINGKTTIDASTLNEGVYNISISSNEGVVNKRLVIVR